jgi:hypothetical protein
VGTFGLWGSVGGNFGGDLERGVQLLAWLLGCSGCSFFAGVWLTLAVVAVCLPRLARRSPPPEGHNE